MKILAGLWLIVVIGATVAAAGQVGVVLAARVLLGSFLAISAGLGAKGAFYQGGFLVGVLLAAVVAGLSWLVLPTSLRLGPALWVPSHAWILTSVIIGFLLGRGSDSERGPFKVRSRHAS